MKNTENQPPWIYYTQAKKIASELASAGFGDWSTRILDAISGGCTSGEILGGILLVFTDMEAVTIPMPDKIKNELRTLAEIIKKELEYT